MQQVLNDLLHSNGYARHQSKSAYNLFFFCRVQYDRINPNTILNSQSAVLFEFVTLLVAKLLHLEVTFFITLNVQMLLN